MKRIVVLAAAGMLGGTVLPTPGAAVAQAPVEDFVIGTGATGDDNFFTDIVIDARSDASGANARGTVSFNVYGMIHIEGPVTCLAVTANRAVITLGPTGFGSVRVEVVDSGSAGSTPDAFFAEPFITDCSAAHYLTFGGLLIAGDIVVHDALPLVSRDQCKQDGWRDYTDDQGMPFSNQGECVSFVVGAGRAA
jgi:hypothetical protein